MKRKISILIIIAILIAGLTAMSVQGASASETTPYDLTGKWNIVANNYNGTLEITNQSGNTFSGTMLLTGGGATKVTDGKITGNTITFTRHCSGGILQHYTGPLNVDASGNASIKGTFTQNGAGRYNWSASKSTPISISTKPAPVTPTPSTPVQTGSYDLTGKWSIAFTTALRGTFDITNQSGNTFSGTVNIDSGKTEKLINGRITGNTITFTRMWDGQNLHQDYTGTLSVDANGNMSIKGAFSTNDAGGWSWNASKTSSSSTPVSTPSKPAPVAAASIQVNATTVRLGEDITASFPSVGNANAWIGFYKTGSTDRQYISYVYLKNVSGSYKVKVPTETGTYNFRLFGDGGYTQKLVTSQTVTVTNYAPSLSINRTGVKPDESVTASYTNGPASTQAWIGLYKTGNTDRQYISYQYLKGSSGSYTVKAPKQAGKYEFRLFQDSGYTRIATSQTFAVTDSPASTPAPSTPSTSATPAVSSAETFQYGSRLMWPQTSGLGYRLFRSTSSSSLGISVTDFYLTSTSFADVNVEPNTSYYYTVKPVLAEARPFQGIEEKLGPTIATFVVKTGGQIHKPGSFKHFILLKIGSPYMSLDGISQEIDPGRGTQPLIISGRTMVPIRAIVEAMGGTVAWDAGARKITLNARGNRVEMWVNKTDLRINGATTKMDVPPVIQQDRTYVPLRFAAENLNGKVDWINSTKEAVIVYED